MSKLGLADDCFIRGNVPMTKSEIRTLTLAKLNLDANDIIWDIGAGTGSISIECAMNITEGQVFAIEKNYQGIELITANKEKFNCNNLHIIHGTAPEVFFLLPKPTKAIIGGSGGNLIQILEYLWQQTNVTTIVINAVTLNTVNLALEFLTKLDVKLEAVQVAVNRIKIKKGYQMLQAQNPIFIINAER